MRNKKPVTGNSFQICVRLDNTDIEPMERLLKQEGLENKSELVRKSLQVYIKIKMAEKDGRVLVLMPKDQLASAPVQLLT